MLFPAFRPAALFLAAFALAAPSTAQPAKEAPVKYSAVQKDPEKHVGKKVSWVGKWATLEVATDADGKEVRSNIYLWRTDNGRYVADFPFVSQGPNVTLTPAAMKADKDRNDKGIRLVSGTIKGSQEVKGGTKVFVAPVLVDVTIDVPH